MTGMTQKLLRNLIYIREHLKRAETLRSLPSYGAGPLIYSLSRLYEIWAQRRPR